LTVSAHPNPGYIFDGWIENGHVLHNVPSEHEFTVNSNRAFTATFKPNNLTITDIEVFGSLERGIPVIFTATATGGIQPLQWSFSIYSNETILYSVDDSAFNFFAWTPFASGNYHVKARCTDATGQSFERIVAFTITSNFPSLRDELAYLIGKAQELLDNTAVSEDGTNIPINKYWAAQEAHDNLLAAILEAIRVLEEYDTQTNS